MSRPIIEVEKLSKLYQIGEIRSFSIKESLEHWWDKKHGKAQNKAALIRSSFFEKQKGPAQNTFWALKDVSFSVQRGEVVGIVGRNGAGKSTLLKILSRITEPTSGRAVMRGRVASLLEVGTGFHLDLSGRENVYLNGAILGMRKREIDRKFDEIVAFAEVEKFIDTPVKHYSSGMYVRLAFAVAAHLDPEILIVDEVLAVGDAAFQRKCLGKMDNLAKTEGRTVLFVNHNMGQIRRLCHSSLWIEGGHCKQKGDTNTVIAEYEKSLTDSQVTKTENISMEGFLGWSINGQNDYQLRTEGPLSIKIPFFVKEKINSAHHGLVLKDWENRNIAGWRFELNLDAGKHDLIYHFPFLPLKPGVYRWYVSLWEGATKIDVQMLSPELILAIPDYGGLSDEWSGFLNIPCHMEHH